MGIHFPVHEWRVEDNHESEIKKIKAFFMNYKITTLIFTQELVDCKNVFETYIKPNLCPAEPEQKISFVAKHNYKV